MEEQRHSNPDDAAGAPHGSLRNFSSRRGMRGMQWALVLIAVLAHAAAFAMLPGPLANALRTAPQLVLSLNVAPAPQHPVVAVAPQSAQPLDEPQDATPAALPHEPIREQAADDAAPPVPPADDARAAQRAEAVHTDPVQIWAEFSSALALRNKPTGTEGSLPEADVVGDETSDDVASEQPVEAAGDTMAPEPEQSAEVDTEAILRQYAADIKRRIMAEKFYPATAERLGHSGSVKVAFTVAADGSVSGLSVRDGADYRSLDEAALAAVRKAGKFPPLPLELGRESLALTITLDYSLR